jgi:hypothetical protein
MRSIFIFATAITTTISVAAAQDNAVSDKTVSGKYLLEGCRVIAGANAVTTGDSFQAGICLGEINALIWADAGNYDENIRSCVPDGTTAQQMARVIVAFFDKNPKRLSEPFEGLALEGLARTWPCASHFRWFRKWFN